MANDTGEREGPGRVRNAALVAAGGLGVRSDRPAAHARWPPRQRFPQARRETPGRVRGCRGERVSPVPAGQAARGSAGFRGSAPDERAVRTARLQGG